MACRNEGHEMILEAVVFFPAFSGPLYPVVLKAKCMFSHNYAAYVSCGYCCDCESPFPHADKIPGRNIIKRKGFVPWSASSVDLGVIAKLYCGWRPVAKELLM